MGTSHKNPYLPRASGNLGVTFHSLVVRRLLIYVHRILILRFYGSRESESERTNRPKSAGLIIRIKADGLEVRVQVFTGSGWGIECVHFICHGAAGSKNSTIFS